mmetsp:Transcript_60811/g.106840  ORF Transcript_60811/g.106840 Transcript_60811/m.106840 type:complete len:249 (-) Transcript_60811:1128-1874(-)
MSSQDASTGSTSTKVLGCFSKALNSKHRCCTSRFTERLYRSIKASTLAGQPPFCATSLLIAVTTWARVRGSLHWRVSWHSLSMICSRLQLVLRKPYSPSTHATACARISGSFGLTMRSRKFSTASVRNSSSLDRPSPSSSASISEPSAISCVKVCATLLFTLSPASSNTRMIVCTYQAFDGANLSAHWVIWPTKSVRKWSSVAVAKNDNSFSTINSTFTALVMRNNKSSVLRFRVSSLSSKQSITAIW